MADQVITVELELSLCIFFWVFFTFNKYSEFLAPLVMCIYGTVGLWRMDCEQSLWYTVWQFVLYVTLLVKHHCHFVVSLVQDMLNPAKSWEGPWSIKKIQAGLIQTILAAIQFRMLHVLIYKTDSVPVILCGCEIWCLASRKEHRLRVCESRVVRRIQWNHDLSFRHRSFFRMYCSQFLVPN